MNKSIKKLLRNIANSPLGDKFVRSLGILRIGVILDVYLDKRKFLNEAKNVFNSGQGILGNYEDYRLALNKHWVTYSEYAFQYAFPEKTEAERDEFVSRRRMAYIYQIYTPVDAKAKFRNKARFVDMFGKYVYRQWKYVPMISFTDFDCMVSKYDCIAKPSSGKLGRGIFKIYKNSDIAEKQRYYDYCVKNKYLIEECVKECDALRAFHPQSLNTLRVVTIANRNKAKVFSGVLRTGVGESVVDNSHAGGLSAQINIDTGVVETDGVNTRGERFEVHPDSGIKFKGFHIPNWDDVVATCCEAAKSVDTLITGWDVAVNINDKVEIIEANYGPDMDMMQARYQKGAKKMIYGLINEYHGINIK